MSRVKSETRNALEQYFHDKYQRLINQARDEGHEEEREAAQSMLNNIKNTAAEALEQEKVKRSEIEAHAECKLAELRLENIAARKGGGGWVWKERRRP